MTELLTAAQMRAIEAAAIASGEVTGLELMERAGRGVVEAIFEEWPELAATSHRAVVLCGPGNNGGDGFVVARLLQEWGWEVEVFLYGDPSRLPPDARVNYERWVGIGEVRELGFPVVRAEPFEDAWESVSQLARRCDETSSVVIDALFGTGLARDLVSMKPLFDLHSTFSYGVKWVSVDLPSGLCANSGKILTPHEESIIPKVIGADLTVTFHYAKLGHHLGDGERYSGRLVMKRIELPELDEDEVDAILEDAGLVDAVQRTGPSSSLRRKNGHKYSHGHALFLSGPSGRGGAARLAARGALRIGAGVVTVGCPPDAIPENAARLDAVMLRGVANADALSAVLEDKRINALCLGPGMGMGEREAGLVAVALGLPVPGLTRDLSSDGGEGGKGGPGSGPGRGKHGRPLVLDADALTILAKNPDLFSALHDGCVLTPHAGEFARLFPDIAEKLAAPATKGPAYSKVDATREAAARAGCVVLYKGPDTVIAGPTGRCAINSAHYDRAAPWLATAGSGDVLAGFITGLLARGFGPFDAACSAAWLHVECALSFGPGLIAEDLSEELPKVFRALGL